MSNGKGSRPRPVNGDKFRANYEAIFGKDNAELFPLDVVEMPSPRKAWLDKHELVTWRTPGLEGCENERGDPIKPWTCCTIEQLERMDAEGLGMGDTEDEACADFAIKRGIRLWNEENA